MLAASLAVALVPALATGVSAADDATELDRVVVSGAHPDGYSAGETSAATGLVLTPRETPQSVSLVTREQIEDFELDNINEVLALTTGVNVERVETGRTYYTARGFDITNFQRDGLGIPLPYGIQNGDVDTAMFERIEVLRGANGLMSSTGNPSATVNFVRKRPTADAQGRASLTLGSFDRVRAEVDVSGPLAASGSARGRAVLAAESSDSYLDRFEHAKAIGYGVIEADLGERTLLTAGVSHQRNDADSPLWGALPLYYTDGTPTNYDRSTSTAADWSYWDTEDTRAFVELAHGIGAGWELRAAYNFERATEDTQIFYVYGTPDRVTGEGLFAYPSDYEGEWDAHQLDVRAAGGFMLGGREHDLVLGAGWSRGDIVETSLYGGVGDPLPAPLEQWSGAFPKPFFDPAFPDGSNFDFRRESVYATARWNLSDAFKLITGANHARVRSTGVGYGEAKDAEESAVTPFVGAVWDVSSNVSLYASYGEIFAQQTEIDINGRTLPSVEGDNAEIGVKGEWFAGRLNASAAVFRVHQDNLAEYAGYDLVNFRSYYAGQDAVSEGIELDIGGSIGEHLSLSAGFAHVQIEDADGNRARTYVPRNTLHAAAVWNLPQLDGLRLGATVRWQDDIYREQSLVLDDGTTVVTRQDAYTTLGLMAGYRFDTGWDATLNIDNVTDEKYLASLYWEQGFYAPPRSASLTVAYRF
ncbi:TonB-dependent siderophore receptor [Lysobacter korlensis]|uniref:TonB-dependent siderophore receptor n=1 Tax=Lysobacter korlensis TaxID=553636 RepID=A0ABV6RVC2_9GAMM